MASATSYIGEHTAEFVLIPPLKKILHRRFESVTPIFPWMTREGSNISFELHGNDEFRLLGLYPRRPKLLSANHPSIFIKINEQILFGAKTGLEFGIPIIGGCPIASDFWELGNDPSCLWINLESDTLASFEIKVESNDSSYLIKTHSECVFRTDEELLEQIDNTAKIVDLRMTLDAIKAIKMQSRGLGGYFPMAFMGGYKPVYFLLK